MLAAAWLTAGATAGLLFGAIIRAWYAHKAFGTQAGHLDLLKQQREDEQGLRKQEVTVLSLRAQEMRDLRAGRESVDGLVSAVAAAAAAIAASG